jgi:DNA/RNA-binding domain of Phe-tRNA-synthetase-like protein
MTEPIGLDCNILVLTDQKRILCIYPYRDADATKINPSTRNVLIVGYGAPDIARNQLHESVETTLDFIKQVAGGKNQTAKVFSTTTQ